MYILNYSGWSSNHWYRLGRFETSEQREQFVKQHQAQLQAANPRGNIGFYLLDNERDELRHVELEAFTGRKWQLLTWSTGRTDHRGQTRIGYELIDPDGLIMFGGSDFAGSPMHADDSDESLRALLSFLTMRPGDTDKEYFANYTPTQLEFAQTFECEALGSYTEPDLAFVNLDDYEG